MAEPSKSAAADRAADSAVDKPRSYTSEVLGLIKRLRELRDSPSLEGYAEEIKRTQERIQVLRRRGGVPSPWEVVQIARHQDRPQTLDYIAALLPDFMELKGDRLRADDSAIVGGMGTLGNRKIVLVGHQKGHTLEERQERSFGMARPEGYRKAMRLARLAEKYGLPLVTLVDTGGAYPGKDAEEGGQAGAIANSILTFTGLKIPTVTVVIGEGGSGGALALAVCDRVFMLENSIYSVISPEGCAALLWRDAAEGPKAAAALHLIAMDLFELGLIDGVIPEPAGGAHTDPAATAKRVMRQVQLAIADLERLDSAERLRLRHEKYLKMGRWIGEG